MSNKEILEKAIQKSIDGGWLPYFHEFDEFLNKDTVVYQLFDTEQRYATILFGAEAKGYVAYAGQYRLTINDLIFNLDFAKALWNDSTDYTVINMPYPDTPPRLYAYQNGYKYHLQQMVIADSPIKYLGEHLND